MSLNDSEVVREQYATEVGLAARKSIYTDVTGHDAREIALQAIADAAPRRVLEVGCGEGELAARMQQELGVELVAIDQSERMVEIACGRGVDARLGDVHDLSFGDASFDVVVAAWMLYHATDLDRAIAELARVVSPGGRLVAVTNASDHLRELLELVGLPDFEMDFRAENGAELLARRFSHVETIEAYGTVTFRDTAKIRSYLGSSARLAPGLNRTPAELAEPLVVRRRPVVFVAERAA